MVVNNLHDETCVFVSIDKSLDTVQKGLRNEKITTPHIKTAHREEKRNKWGYQQYCSGHGALSSPFIQLYCLEIQNRLGSTCVLRSLLIFSPFFQLISKWLIKEVFT